jgi:uncharacterized lipoprotein YehR (DUF1307 family)
MNKFLTIILVALCVIGVSGCGNKENSTNEPEKATTSGITSAVKSSTSEAAKSAETSAVESAAIAEHRTGDKIVGVSNKDISDVDITFDDNVRNDTTGKWRLAETADNIDLCKYALSYYKKYFKSDDEVHCFINFTNNTTAVMTVMPDYAIQIVFHDYVDKEEHDASILGSGTELGTYFVYLDNGDIEKID